MRALLLLLVATPAFAGNNEVSLGSNLRSLHTASANAVTDNSLSGGGVTYARALDVPVYPKVALWAEGSFTSSDAKGEMFQSMATQVGSTTLTAGLRARYAPYRALAVSGRFAVGSAKTSLSVDDGHGMASDAGWSPMATGAVALDVLAAGTYFGIGLRLEMGYVAATGVSLTPKRDTGSSDTLMLSSQTQSFGTLNLSGAYMSFGLVSEF